MGDEELESFFRTGSPVALPPSRLQDRYRGALIGVAVGNALGIPVEGMSRQTLRARFPDGLREVDPRERHRPWDDDLAQTVLLAEAMLERGGLDLEDLAARLLRWARENGRGMGHLTRRVIRELSAGNPVHAAARHVWEQGDRQPAGNGAVMRCAPVALGWRRSGARLVEEARKSALVTHYDPRCVWSTIAMSGAIALSLGGSALDLEQLASLIGRAGASEEVAAAIRAVRGAPLEALALDRREDMGYTLKAMQVGLWALQQGDDFEAVLVEVVNAGGDTDSNGAVAGAAMGSLAGFTGIPRRWVANIREADRLLALADRLFEASERG